MHIDIGLVVAGLVILTLGGELALRGAVGLACGSVGAAALVD